MPTFVLGETETIICNYPTYSDQEGNHKVTKKFVLTFIVDKENKITYILGNQGSEKVKMIPSVFEDSISFIEITRSGNVMTTTIDSTGASVHSRNTVINGRIVPTQYYGKCEFS